MKARSLGLIFVAAVMVPSVALSVLSVRAAGREEAFVEKQVATALDAETSHTAALATTEMGDLVEELRAGASLPATGAYGPPLRRWKAASPLVDVPFLLSPRYGILWPTADAGTAERRFLQENGAFLSDQAATSVLQNIADRYNQEILARSGAAPGVAVPTTSVPGAAAPAKNDVGAADQVAPAGAEVQQARDAFAQNPAIQTEVYKAAAERGDILSARVVQPQVMAASGAPAATVSAAAPTAAPAVVAAPTAAPASSAAAASPAPSVSASVAAKEEAPAQSAEAQTAGAQEPVVPKQAPQRAAPPPSTPAQPAPGQPSPQQQPSQYVVTSQLLSQIASAGDAGIIPRFTNSGLVFLFWARQADGRIAGCLVNGVILRQRVAAVLGQTATDARILTILDDNGVPLAQPPGQSSVDWRRPFVSREIGPLLPRWEAAAYLTHPDSVARQARATSLVIWIMVLILFVSVAGGGIMVLTSVTAEMRMAQRKATFVANVSHELKTPLTSISLFIELLRQKRQVPAQKRASWLAHMASETERLTRLINNVLDFSAMTGARPGRGAGPRYAMEEVDAGTVTGQIVESQRVRVESKGFLLVLAVPPDPAPLRADPEALKQVLLNLLTNAEKYSQNRKEITVVVEDAPGRILIHVLDRGVGVPPKDRDRIFREFVRLDDSLASGVQGTGLGLTIARRIARDHGGDITCHGRSGGGSDFVVVLPRGGPGGKA